MSDNEIDEAHLSEDEIEVDTTEQKALKPKQSCIEINEELTQMQLALDTIDANFNEKDKQYEKDKKEYQANRKKAHKDIEQLRKKFDKALKHDMSRVHKTRKTGNSGKGGFNKVIPVPKKLCDFLELEHDAMMSRPKVTHLLNEKFKALKFRSVENGKVVKISDKKAAKTLGCEMNHTIEFNQLQAFIAKFYNDEKPVIVA